jgi:hypothetical protein
MGGFKQGGVVMKYIYRINWQDNHPWIRRLEVLSGPNHGWCQVTDGESKWNLRPGNDGWNLSLLDCVATEIFKQDFITYDKPYECIKNLVRLYDEYEED